MEIFKNKQEWIDFNKEQSKKEFKILIIIPPWFYEEAKKLKDTKLLENCYISLYL